jgi:hypothetical protein
MLPVGNDTVLCTPSRASASWAISASDRKRSTLRTGAFLTPRAGLSAHKPRSTANAKIALTSATHCAATPLPPVAMLPDRRFSNGSRPQSVNIAQSRSQMES